MKRVLSVVVLGVLMALASVSVSVANAAEAEIGDFHRFECNTPDGKRLKPKLGNIDGALFIDLPAQSEDCHAMVDRAIVECGENIRFSSNTKNREYPECFPIFEEQARQCEAFFRGERAKCDTGAGTEAGTGASAEAAEDALGLSRAQRRRIQENLAGAGFNPGGADGSFGPRTRAAIRGWQDEAGAEATGYLTERQASTLLEGGGRETSSGAELLEGVGNWGLRDAEGDSYDCTKPGDPSATHTWEGRCTGGKPTGKGVYGFPGGSAEGAFVDGGMRGRWVVRFADGKTAEGQAIGRANQIGRWVYRYTDGEVGEGSMDGDNELTGRWHYTRPDGSTYQACYRAGEEVDC